jgi:hypothetical protein
LFFHADSFISAAHFILTEDIAAFVIIDDLILKPLASGFLFIGAAFGIFSKATFMSSLAFLIFRPNILSIAFFWNSK